MRKTISSAKSATTAFEPCASRKRKALKSWPVRRACRSRRGTTYASSYDRMEPPSICKTARHRNCWVKWQNPALPRPSSDFTCKMGSNSIWRTFSVDPSGSSRFLRQPHLDTPSDDAHFPQTIRLASRTGTPPAVSDIWFPPARVLAGIWILTCHTPENASGTAETETTAAPFAVTTGGEVTPRPLRNNVTVELAEAGFRQVLTDPSGLKASGDSPLTEAALSMVHVSSAGEGIAILRNAAGLLATIGRVSESEMFDRAEANLMFACAPPAIPKGAWKLICSPPTYSSGLGTPLTSTVAPSSEVETCPGGGVAGLQDENSPNSDNNSPGAIEVTGLKSAESRMPAMGVWVALGSTAMTLVPLVAIGVLGKPS